LRVQSFGFRVQCLASRDLTCLMMLSCAGLSSSSFEASSSYSDMSIPCARNNSSKIATEYAQRASSCKQFIFTSPKLLSRMMQFASIYRVGIWSRASHFSVIVAEVGDDAKDGVIFHRGVADDAGPRHLTGDEFRCGIQNSRSLLANMISAQTSDTHTQTHRHRHRHRHTHTHTHTHTQKYTHTRAFEISVTHIEQRLPSNSSAESPTCIHQTPLIGRIRTRHVL
jgi:hypothetical protein